MRELFMADCMFLLSKIAANCSQEKLNEKYIRETVTMKNHRK